jgi:hypothetical protein
MGVLTLEVGYTSATTGRGDHEVHKGHVVALGGGKFIQLYNEPNIFNVIKSSRVRWAGHVELMDDNELPKQDIVDKTWRSKRTWPTEIEGY